MGMEVNRFEVVLVKLEPPKGSEIKKTRPCLIVSPNEINHHLRTLIVAPVTSQGREYPTRIVCTFQCKTGQIVLDQMRTIDRDRIVKRLGIVDAKTKRMVVARLAELFAA